MIKKFFQAMQKKYYGINIVEKIIEFIDKNKFKLILSCSSSSFYDSHNSFTNGFY